jgi:hypothetical protein
LHPRRCPSPSPPARPTIKRLPVGRREPRNSHLVKEEVARHTGGRRPPLGGRGRRPVRATPTRPTSAPLPDPAWRRSSPPPRKFARGGGHHQPALRLLTGPQHCRHVQSAGERRMDKEAREGGRCLYAAIPARASIRALPLAAREVRRRRRDLAPSHMRHVRERRMLTLVCKAPVICATLAYGSSI